MTLLEFSWCPRVRRDPGLLSFALSMLLGLALLPTPAKANSEPPPPLPTEPTLQELLDQVTLPPLALDADNPSGVEVFQQLGDEVFFALTFEFNPLEVYNTEFGIYDVRDPDALNVIFSATSPALSTANVAFDPGAFPEGFGMYIRNVKTGATFFSQSDLNPGAQVFARTFQGAGDAEVVLRDNYPVQPFDETDYIVAFDDGGDFDFNDVFVYVWTGIQEPKPIPEPSTLSLLALGFAALVFGRRAQG